jgi:hypothetical protein
VYCADLDRRGNAMLILYKGCLFIRHRVNIRSDSFITSLRSLITETHINMTTDCGSALIGDTHLSANSRHDGNPMSNIPSDRGFVIQSDHITTITRRYMPCHVKSRTLNFRTHGGRNTVTWLIWRCFVKQISYCVERYGCCDMVRMCKEAVAAYFPHHNGICLEKTDENVGSWYTVFGPSFPTKGASSRIWNCTVES